MENDDKALAAVKFVVAVKVVVVSGGVIVPLLLLFPICEGALEEEGAKDEFSRRRSYSCFHKRTDKGGVGFGEKWTRKFKSSN